MTNKSENLYFKLFADCFPIKGDKRGIMYDLNRKRYKFIPNSMIDFIGDSDMKNKSSIYKAYDEEEHKIVDEYINFLETNDFIFWIPEPLKDNFSKLDLQWDYPAQITNVIIDIGENSSYDVGNVLTQLERMGCKHIQIRAYCKTTIDYYDKLLLPLINSSYLSIEIITQYIDTENELTIKELINKHKRVKAFILHSAPFSKIINERLDLSMGNIAYTQQKIFSSNDCNHNSAEYFNTCVNLFTESQLHHSYFNRKVSIDVEGNIKNCTSDSIKYGNVNTHKIADIIATSEFQKLWFVKKDDTEVCKDCEFRYMCTDSRIPYRNADGMWEHKEECNYNPYISKWKGEPDYISVKDFKQIAIRDL